MVYGRYRRSYRKNYRTRRALSTRNIFNNKGSRSQANQIFRLNRKVNNIYKQCKPELKIIETQPQTFFQIAYETNFDNPANILPNFSNPYNPAHSMSISMPDNGDGDNELIGNVCNLKDMTVFLNVNYDIVKDTRLNSIPNDFSDQSYIRFVFLMSKNPSDELIEPNGIFDITLPNTMNPNLGITTLGTYPAGYRLNTVLPFKEGTASRYTILKDIRVKVGSMSPDKQLRVKIPLSKLVS